MVKVSIVSAQSIREWKWKRLTMIIGILNVFIIHSNVLAIPIDYRFSDSPGVEIYPSTPEPCIKNHRYDNKSGTCQRLGEKGNCGNNMILVEMEGSKEFGECDCNFQKSDVPLIYHEATDECYPIFTKAFCDPGKWLIWSSNDRNNAEPICVNDKCRNILFFGSENNEKNTIVFFHGRCVQLYSRNSNCKFEEVVTFTPDDLLPSCGRMSDDQLGLGFRLHKTKRLPCKKGSQRDRTGKCRVVVSSTTTTTTTAPSQFQSKSPQPQLSFPTDDYDDKRR